MPTTLIETCAIPDTFVTNIGQIETLGGCARLVFYVDRNEHRQIVAKLVMPIGNVPMAITMATAKLGKLWEVPQSAPLRILGTH